MLLMWGIVTIAVINMIVKGYEFSNSYDRYKKITRSVGGK